MLSNEQFQDTVLRGVNAVTEKVDRVERSSETLLKNYDQLGRETKLAMEDISRLRNHANEQSKILQSLQKLQLNLRQEAVAAGIDPIQRVLRDDRKRGIFNMIVRQAVDSNGDMRRPVTTIAKSIGEDAGEGSTLVIAQLYKEIYDTLAEYGDWNTLGVRRLGTKVTNFPIHTARVVANWITTEASVINDDANEAGTTLTLTVLPNAVLLNVSRQLIEDAEFDVTAFVLEDFRQAWNQRLDQAAFLGAGNGANGNDGGFTGMFVGGTQYSAGQGNTPVSTMTFDDVNKALLTVAPIVLKRKPCWWMHPQMLARVMGIKDNYGRPIFLSALEAPAYGSMGTILGYPVIPVFVAPNTDGPGQQVLAFGDRNGQVVGVRDDFVFESSDHFRWNTLERSFRAFGRAATGTRQANAFAVLSTAKA